LSSHHLHSKRPSQRLYNSSFTWRPPAAQAQSVSIAGSRLSGSGAGTAKHHHDHALNLYGNGSRRATATIRGFGTETTNATPLSQAITFTQNAQPAPSTTAASPGATGGASAIREHCGWALAVAAARHRKHHHDQRHWNLYGNGEPDGQQQLFAGSGAESTNATPLSQSITSRHRASTSKIGTASRSSRRGVSAPGDVWRCPSSVCTSPLRTGQWTYKMTSSYGDCFVLANQAAQQLCGGSAGDADRSRR